MICTMSIKPGDFVMPGDVLNNIDNVKSMALVGPGLRQSDEPNSLIVTRAGVLCHKAVNTYWIETAHKRYIPKKGDLVVGIIVKKSGDTIKVDIGGAELASLSLLAFEGATKKQKPDLLVGDVIYAKLLSAHKEMEPELVCIDKYFKAGNLGPLSSDGFIITVSPSLVYRLLNIEHPLLRTLGKKFPFEIAIGVNGKIWFNAKDTKNILTLMNCLLIAEKQNDKDLYDLCKQY